MTHQTPIGKLWNLGPKSCQWLQAIGIDNVEELRQVGAIAAYELVRAHQPEVSLNLLWALAAGLEDRDWRELTQAEKQKLIAQLK